MDALITDKIQRLAKRCEADNYDYIEFALAAADFGLCSAETQNLLLDSAAEFTLLALRQEDPAITDRLQEFLSLIQIIRTIAKSGL